MRQYDRVENNGGAEIDVRFEIYIRVQAIDSVAY